MKQISSMDLYYLCKEFQSLLGGKLNQIYQIEKEELLFEFHITNEGKKMLKVVLPSLLYLTQYKGLQPTTPPGFCTFLRRRLKNSRLQKIEQLEFERILKLEFSTKEKNYLMFIELFAEGNVILSEEDGKIISPLLTGNWKERTIRGGVIYNYPKRLDTLNLTKEELEKIIKNSDKENIVKTLAINLSFGGEYAEKICDLAGIDKNSKNFNGIFEAIQKIKTDFPKFEKFNSFNEYLDETLTKNKIQNFENQQISKKEKELSKHQRVINQQITKIKELEKGINDAQKIGELIYNNYMKVEEILKSPERLGKLNKKDKTVEVEL